MAVKRSAGAKRPRVKRSAARRGGGKHSATKPGVTKHSAIAPIVARPVTTAAPSVRRRLQPQQRERQILDEATRYFAESGFGGGTLELARRLGITQPLLYKYFPTKEAMIGKVFDGLFPGHWDPRWESLLDDTTIPLAERLKRFYNDYARRVLTYEHVRLFLFSGLSHLTFNSRYYDILTERIFMRIARALRAEHLPAGAKPSSRAITDDELEVVQSLHAAVYHVGFRQWIHTPPLKVDIERMIELKVDLFIDGARATMARLAPSSGNGRGKRTAKKA